jgi:hypothetical protein
MRFRSVAVFGASFSLLGAACSLLLDLQPPPSASPDSGDEGATDDGPPSDGGPSSDAPLEGPTCAPLDAALPDAGGDGTTAFRSIVQGLIDDSGIPTWRTYDLSQVSLKAGDYMGGTFDGKYVYFAPRGNGFVTRYDISLSFTSYSAWQGYDVSLLDPKATGFRGAVYDGRYVYFVPGPGGDQGMVVRFDTQGTFASSAAWSAFDTTTLPVGASLPAGGFAGGVFDGRYFYLVPSQYGPTSDAAWVGRVARYDTQDDAGVHADAGDGEAALPIFGGPSQWSTFDTSSAYQSALGFVGGVFDGRFVYLVPYSNGGQNNGGASGIVSRYDTTATGGFTSKSSWTFFDSLAFNPRSFGYSGGVFDGRYMYLVPRYQTVVSRYDTHATQFSANSSWSAFDVGSLFPAEAGAPSFFTGAFDGRFVYLVPFSPSLGTVVRYDTLSTFEARCAWSLYDVARANSAATQFQGAVYDGRYLYLLPHGTTVARFDTKTTTWMPALPDFSGSFL